MSVMRIEETPGIPGSAHFEATPWSLVQATKDVTALNELLQTDPGPILTERVRRRVAELDAEGL